MTAEQEADMAVVLDELDTLAAAYNAGERCRGIHQAIDDWLLESIFLMEGR